MLTEKNACNFTRHAKKFLKHIYIYIRKVKTITKIKICYKYFVTQIDIILRFTRYYEKLKFSRQKQRMFYTK